MKTIVIYKSSTGFTKQYAEWIAEEIFCKAVSVKQAKSVNMNEYDQVIFGGWVMGGIINGLEEVKKLNPKKSIVFAVGATPENIMDMNKLREENHLENNELLYLQGGMRFDELNFAVKGMLKMIKKSLIKNNDQTPQGMYMKEMLGTNFDISDKKYIKPVVDCALR